MATASRHTVRTLAVLLLSVLFLAGTARTADAADGYKYWNYFHVTGGKYVFASTGPADYTPKDGSVEAYRFGLSSAASGLPPRAAATTYTADTICAGTEAGAGEKLVGVLLDYGTAADAESGETPPEPRADCAAVPAAANGQQVLDAVADVRTDQGLTCGIDGYPVKVCSVTVKNAPRAATNQTVDFALPEAAAPEASASADPATESSADSASDSQDGGAPWTLVAVGVVVLLLAAGGLALARRSRNA
jgi:hypothetical protein